MKSCGEDIQEESEQYFATWHALLSLSSINHFHKMANKTCPKGSGKATRQPPFNLNQSKVW